MIRIEDVKKNVLTGSAWDATDEYGLFHFTNQRGIQDACLFDDCHFIDLCIAHKTDWGAPIPSTFQLFLPRILKIIMPQDNILVLNMVDTAERTNFRYLDNEEFVKTFLRPKGYNFFFLEKQIGMEWFSTVFFRVPTH